MQKVAIIGAGISGLSAAWTLQKKDIAFTLFEASERIGGAIRTLHEADCLIEAGPNSLSGPHPELDRLISELGLQSEYCPANARANKRFVVRNGQPIAVPHSPLSFLRTPLFSTRAKWRLLAEPFICSRAAPGESLAAFAERRMGKEPLAYALNPFVSGIYAGDPEALLVETAFPTLLQMEKEHGSLLRALLHRAKHRRRSGELRKPRTIYSFTQGMQTLPNRLAEKIGDAIQTHHPITSIQQEDGAWLIENQRYSDIILTLPAYAQTQLDAPFDLSFLASIRYPAVTSLSLLYRRDQLTHPLNGFGMLVPACEERFILGVLFPSSIFPDRAPDECALLTVFVGGDRTPERAHLPEADLISRVEADLQDLLGLNGHAQHVRISRWEQAIPQYTQEIKACHSQLDDIESDFPGIHFAGNYRDGISIAQAIESGRKVAERMIERHSSGKETCSSPTVGRRIK